MAAPEAAAATTPAAAPWWHRPFRVFQTNLREIDAGLDVEAVLDDIADFGANAWLLNAGGIVSFYPSRLDFQQPSPWLAERPSGDLLGDAVAAAHRRDVRLIARCDFSKLPRAVYEQHPDWFYVSPAGRPQVYNDLFSCCPCAPYYQTRAFEVVDEILERYAPDGFFFNMFNHPLRDYSGGYHGICQCVHCRTRFGASSGLELPQAEDWRDPAYLAWRPWSRGVLEDLAGRVRAFIKDRRPQTALLLRMNSDVTFHEVNNAVDRPLPLWPYWAGEFGREARTAHPERPAVCNAVMFLDIPYRFTAEQPGLVGLHLAQIVSQGVNPWAYVIGTTRNQPDRTNFPIVRQMLTFHRQHETLYAGLRSAARVALVSSIRSEEQVARARGGRTDLSSVLESRRGAYRALLEGHVPFDILPDDQLVVAAADGRLAAYDALVLPDLAVLDDAQASALDGYVAAGGGLVATYETGAYGPDGRLRDELALASLGARRVLSRREGPSVTAVPDPSGLSRPLRSAYLRLTRREDLPGFEATDQVMLDRAFLSVEVRPGAEPSLELVPASRYGPPEKIYSDLRTQLPGLLHFRYGQGRTAYFPWPVDQLYFHHSLPAHRALLLRALDTVSGRDQSIAQAPACVEATLGRAADGRLVVHLINYSGHRDRAYDDPLPIFDLTLPLPASATNGHVRALVADTPLDSQAADGVLSVRVPRLGLFEVIVFGAPGVAP